jgi:hypothetical protein
MKIKMKTSAAGPGGIYQEGQSYDVPDHIGQKQAIDFIHGGYAADISPPVKKVVAETATMKPAEKATAIPQRK